MSHSHEYFYQLSISFYCLVSIFHKTFIKNQRWALFGIFQTLYTSPSAKKAWLHCPYWRKVSIIVCSKNLECFKKRAPKN